MSQAEAVNFPPPQSRWHKLRARISQFFEQDKTVKIGAMEINLTAIWEELTAPFVWIYKKLFGKKARSRRQAFDPRKNLKQAELMRLIGIGSLAVVFLGILMFFILFAWYSRDLPKPGQVVRREGFSTRIFDREGKPLYDLFNQELRNPVKLADIPENLQRATVAIEDKDFYKHGGFDFLTILRIPYNFIVRQRVVGGSTLTQQLVKNVLLTSDRTISRKFKEFVLSLQIERKFTKDEILEMYLNEAPYGGAAWGVGAASEMYFDKPVRELNLVEAVILAGLPQRPSAYSPFAGRTDEDGKLLWKLRAEGVLRRMKEDDYITKLEYEDALAELDKIEFATEATDIQAPHFVFYVRDQLEEMFGPEVVEAGGLQVTTTLDLDLQEKSAEIVKNEIESLTDLNITNGAALAMNPQTGEILSMVGSADYFNSEIGGQFNVVTDGLRQPGSSIKPITYLGLIRQGYTPAFMLVDAQTTFTPDENAEEPYIPQNYDGEFRGPVSLRNSLGSSLNVPAVKSLALLGIDNFLELAYDMGFETLAPSEENFKRFGLALT